MNTVSDGKLLFKLRFENNEFQGVPFGEILKAVDFEFPNVSDKKLTLGFSEHNFSLVVERIKNKEEETRDYIFSPPRTLAYVREFLADKFPDWKNVLVRGGEDSGRYDYLKFG